MPEVIEEVTPARKSYPWSKWSDGKPRKLTRGRDFDVEAARFRYTIHGAARRMGLKAKVAVKGDAVEFQFVKPGKEKPKSAKPRKSKSKSKSR